jgi:hypothetical protein
MIYSIEKTEHDIDYGILIMQREKKKQLQIVFCMLPHDPTWSWEEILNKIAN